MSCLHWFKTAWISCLAALMSVVTCHAASADPQDATAAAGPAARPRIGLVLAGGGAKGGAHVGVLKVLEQMRVPIDCIAGTSMGALIGAGYAAGMPARDIEEFLTGVDWKAVIGGVGQRSLEPIEQKRFAAEAATLFELGLQHGGVVPPPGLINTSSIENLLRSYVAKARTVPDFNQLPIPFRAVATDMVSGRMVVLDHGDLATAMRASMAIPGAFAPVLMDDYILADGGMVRNIPVDVARQTCADVVIVVNLVEPPVQRDKLVTAVQLVGRSTGVMLEANERLQLQTLTARDVRIDVPTGDIGTADFERTPETIPLGEAAAREAAARLAPYAVSEQDYTAWRARVTTEQEIETRLADVRFEGLQSVNADYLRTLTVLRAGDSVDTAAISNDALRMSVLDDLNSVEYRLLDDPAHPALVWLPKEKTIGPDFLRPVIGLYADGGGDLDFALGVQHVRRWLNAYGGQWRNRVQLGFETLFATSLYQPINVAQTFFIEPQLLARRSIEDVYNDGTRIATYQLVDLGGGVELGANLAKSGQVRVGYWLDDRRSKVNTGIALLPEFNFTDAGLSATAILDTRDSPAFATRGVAAQVEYMSSDSSLGADRDWERIEGGLRVSKLFGKRYVWVTAAGGADLGNDLPGDRAFSLGGPQSFPGYAHDELRARSYWTVSGNLLWRMSDQLSIRNKALYGGLGLQAGWLYDRVDPVPDGEIYGVSAYFGGESPIGFVTFGAGKSADSWAAWIAIGRPVGKGSILDEALFR